MKSPYNRPDEFQETDYSKWQRGEDSNEYHEETRKS
jgi:hypothetical protein